MDSQDSSWGISSLVEIAGGSTAGFFVFGFLMVIFVVFLLVATWFLWLLKNYSAL